MLSLMDEQGIATGALEAWLDEVLASWGDPRRVLLIPPDYTRAHSGAGPVTVHLYRRLTAAGARVLVLPALGTHAPMTADQRARLYPGIPDEAFRVHRWREDVRVVGTISGAFIAEVSGGRVDYPIDAELNRLILEEPWDRVVSIGQVVPHEVVGMANHAKNLFVGTGGSDTIHRTHFLGAVAGIESILGRVDTPVRAVLDRMASEFATNLPVVYIQTVRDRDPATGDLRTRGVFAGSGRAPFEHAAALAQRCNLTLLSEPIRRAVVWLDPDEYHSTWLGNKAVYRLRMAMADDGELLVIAPGVHTFGEDARIDELIRRHGYRTTPEVLARVDDDPDLAANLSAAAHLIHGSPEERFRVTLAPGHLTRDEVESVCFHYADCEDMMRQYRPESLRDGFVRTAGGGEVFFVSNPATGLWALESQFPVSETV